MEVRITGRRGNLTEDVKDYAHEKIAPLGRFNRHARSVELIFDEDHLSQTVEAIAHLDRGAPVVVHSKHEDARAASDLTHDKLERVLRRLKERREARRHKRVDAVPGMPPAASGDGTGPEDDRLGEEE